LKGLKIERNGKDCRNWKNIINGSIWQWRWVLQSMNGKVIGTYSIGAQLLCMPTKLEEITSWWPISQVWWNPRNNFAIPNETFHTWFSKIIKVVLTFSYSLSWVKKVTLSCFLIFFEKLKLFSKLEKVI